MDGWRDEVDWMRSLYTESKMRGVEWRCYRPVTIAAPPWNRSRITVSDSGIKRAASLKLQCLCRRMGQSMRRVWLGLPVAAGMLRFDFWMEGQ
ncbi:uncharacterized protein SPSK_02842 [Sporothrix schenckii 1099-18]|uniref:Uncharacterized protein n=1 Tax=Sporothrix schenckii 1099-18 TaxID=1397361 RepID=A0A0F2M9Z9_SPOSC|nr:uncharacterized protein SPSK_02842 [Sporothrix schenckii 1099-18]KJR86513.1 hypothetical protein SPSK_02842 [Sporothrix schenckii 1099-18]